MLKKRLFDLLEHVGMVYEDDRVSAGNTSRIRLGEKLKGRLFLNKSSGLLAVEYKLHAVDLDFENQTLVIGDIALPIDSIPDIDKITKIEIFPMGDDRQKI